MLSSRFYIPIRALILFVGLAVHTAVVAAPLRRTALHSSLLASNDFHGTRMYCNDAGTAQGTLIAVRNGSTTSARKILTGEYGISTGGIVYKSLQAACKSNSGTPADPSATVRFLRGFNIGG